MKKLCILILLTGFAFILMFGAEVAILYSPTSEKHYTQSTYKTIVNGLIDALNWAKIDYVTINTLQDTIPEGVKVIIDPSNAALNDSEVEMIWNFLMKGGRVLAAYESGLRYPDGKLRPNYIYGDFLNIRFKGWMSGGYNYLQLTDLGKEIFGIQKTHVKMPRGFAFVFETTGQPLAIWTKDEKGTITNDKYPVAAVLSPSGIFFGENIYLHTALNDDIKLLIANSIRYLLSQPPVEIDKSKFEILEIQALIDQIEQTLAEEVFLLKKSEIEKIKARISEIKTGISDLNVEELSNVKSELEEISLKLKKSYKVQTRAIWLDYGAILRTGSPENLRHTIRKLHEYGFNVVLPEVIYKGMTISPKLSNYEQQTEFAAWPEDPLEVIINEAHKLGMEVHAWCWVFAVSHGNAVSPLMKKFPHLLEKDKYGNVFTPNQTAWFSHANPEARKYLMEGILEVAKLYDVDGINLDYIRYDSDDMGFDEYSVQLFKEQTGIDPYKIEKYSKEEVTWQLWREKQVSSFVEEFYKRVKAIKPSLIISADVFPSISGARMVKKQNWEEWLYKGILDVVIPMNYFGSVDDLKINLEKQAKYKAYTYFYPGLQMISLKSTKELMDQVYAALDYFNYGVVLFSLAYVDKFDFNVLKNGIFRNQAVPAHKDLPNLTRAFDEELRETLGLLTDYGLKSEEKEQILKRWQIAKEKGTKNDVNGFFNDISNLLFFVSGEVENPKVNLKLSDFFSWILDIVRPKILKGTVEYKIRKPEGMIIVENLVPLPKAIIPKRTINVDGDLSDWAGVDSLSEFRTYDTGEVYTPLTKVKVAYDEKNLYVLFICEDPDLEGVKKVSGPRDTRTYLGDSIEVFILKDEAKKEYYHFVIGIDGTLYDEAGYDSKWNGTIEYKTWQNDKAWYCELAIDMGQFSINPEPGKTLRVNFNRNRWRGNRPEYSGWSVTYGSYHTVERFGKVIFGE